LKKLPEAHLHLPKEPDRLRKCGSTCGPHRRSRSSRREGGLAAPGPVRHTGLCFLLDDRL